MTNQDPIETEVTLEVTCVASIGSRAGERDDDFENDGAYADDSDD